MKIEYDREGRVRHNYLGGKEMLGDLKSGKRVVKDRGKR